MIFLASQTTVVVLSIVIFLLAIIAMVGLLLYVKTKLTPKGMVKVNINNDFKVIETNPGDTLLTTLGNNKVLLPSACGGGGTCGMCRCQIEYMVYVGSSRQKCFMSVEME